MSHHRTEILVGLLLTAATVTAYGPLWLNGLLGRDDGYGFVAYDDDVYVTRNLHVEAGLTMADARWAFTTTHASNWHPLTWLSLQLDAQLYPGWPWGFHLTNLFLHLANVLLLFVLLRHMTGAVWPSGLVAALFAVHPLHVESVAWVSERKDVLSTFFGLLALAAYVAYARRPTVFRFVPVVVAFGLSLLAKPMLVTLPCVLLLLDYWPLRRLDVGRTEHAADGPGIRPETLRRLVVEKLPLFGLALASCAVTVYAQHRGGALRPLDQLSPAARATNALVAYTTYLGKTFWPVRLAVFYPHPRQIPPWWQVAGAGLILAAISAVAVREAQRRPYLLVGWLWFLGTLVPVIGLVQVGAQALADRYTYVPLIGLFVAVAWGIADAVRRWTGARGLILLGTGLFVLGCVVCCRIQVGYWHDSVTLWEHTRAVTEGNYVAANNLGVVLDRDLAEPDQALACYDEAIRIRPDYVDARVNRAALFRKRGRWEEAEQDLRAALRVRPGNAEFHNDLGTVLAVGGDLPAAAREFVAAIQADPEHADAHYNLGVALGRLGEPKEAVVHGAEAVRLRPRDARYRRELAFALEEEGRAEAARAEYRQAVALDPTWPDALNRVAWQLATDADPKRRNGPLSLRLARQVCTATDGDRPEFLETLAAAYAATERFDAAAATARKALAAAETAGHPDLARRIEASLRRYESGRQPSTP